MATTITDLTISGEDMPPYAVRGVRMTIEPIDEAANLHRAVDGSLIDFSASQMRKVAVKLTCSDVQAPAFQALWPGTALTIDLPGEIAYKTSGGAAAFSVVSGSARTEGSYSFYRPQLAVKVTRPWSYEFDELAGDYAWTLECEEA